MIFKRDIHRIQEEQKFHAAISRIIATPQDQLKELVDDSLNNKKEYEFYTKYGKADPNTVYKNAKLLRREESYRGRIDFDTYFSLFCFEEYIYIDKQRKYYNLKSKNSIVTADFAASILSRYIAQGFISKDMRKYIEGFVLARMTNLEYQLCSNFDFLKESTFECGKTRHRYGLIIGSIQSHFDAKKIDIIKEGIKISSDHKASLNLQCVFLITDLEIDSQAIKAEIEGRDIKYLNDKLIGIKKKMLFAENLNFLFSHMALNKDLNSKINTEEWELILFTSSYQAVRVAQEVEKYIHETDMSEEPFSSIKECFDKLKRVVIISSGNIFDLFDYKDIENDEAKLKIHKLKSMLFELYNFSLNKNNH